MKKISKKQLEHLANTDLIFPDNAKKLIKEKEDFYKSIGVTEEQLDYDDSCPEEFWWYASDLAIQLANELLEEREKKYNDLIEPIDDIIRELKNLKKKINQKIN